MRMKIFRWKAIGPLLLFLAILIVLVVIFAEPIAHDTTEEASTELLGTQVDVGKLDLRPRESSVDLRALQIANPFALDHNLLEADEIRLRLNPLALAEKKLVIERLSLSGMRFGTARKTPAKPVKGGGFAPKLLQAVDQWGQQFDVPLLSLTPIDTIRQLALDPTQLTTIREAQTLAARTDSRRWTPPVPWLNGSRPPIRRSWDWTAPGRRSSRYSRRSGSSTPPRSGWRGWSGVPARGYSSSARALSCWIKRARGTSRSPNRCSSCQVSPRLTSGVRFSAR
jgi:hypothetical protein